MKRTPDSARTPANPRPHGTTRSAATAAAVACLALGALGTATGTAQAATTADPAPGAPAVATAADVTAARAAATAPATLDTLSRFFARDGVVARSAAQPRAEGATVPVLTLSPEFVAKKAGAPVARTEFLATPAVSADGQKASVWTARSGSGWEVINIATGDDEFRYARAGAAKLPGGTVFREPQTDSWYVTKGSRVLPLDEDATRAIGARGTTLAAYQNRVTAAYGDKLPGSAYAKKGFAGGYEAAANGATSAADGGAPAGPVERADRAAANGGSAVTAASAAAGAGAVTVLALTGFAALRRRRSAHRA
ncbi:hypothetical protein ACH41E_19275 [Streptomyces sp. NPDC020412]|uniref:hypothetical protein n=1 Tax=Streptomyces sp. NPDC020412 TaxID=3365073 RepID=UPI00378C6218